MILPRLFIAVAGPQAYRAVGVSTSCAITAPFRQEGIQMISFSGFIPVAAGVVGGYGTGMGSTPVSREETRVIVEKTGQGTG